jgi:hypothetical protein
MGLQPSALVGLLGLPASHPGVEAALAAFRITRRPCLKREIADDPRSDIVDVQDWLANRKMGVEFGFEDESSFLGAHPADYGHGPMLLTELYFFLAHPDQGRYAGPLPFGLAPEDDRPAVRGKLSKYSKEPRFRTRDTWTFPEFDFVAAYTDSPEQLSYVVFIKSAPIRWPDDELRARCPVASALTSLVGREENDALLQRTVERLKHHSFTNLDDEDLADIDLREDFGLVLHFERSGRSATRNLVGYTLLRDRQYGSARWPGDLPANLNFDSSWGEIIARLGRPPDDLEETSFDLTALWHVGALTLEVLYSTMHNHILSVTVSTSSASANTE